MFSSFIAIEQVAPLFHSLLDTSSNLSLFLAFVVMISIVTVLDLMFGALVPKSIALHRSESIALSISRVLSGLMKVLRPLTRIPVLASNLILGPLRDHTSFTESRISEEEFRVMLEEGARSGAIDKTENELIENIFAFNERTAREIMVPRIKMVALNTELPREKFIEKTMTEGFTRLPVYQDTLDNVIGVIYSKDVLSLIEHPELIILYDIIRPVPFIPETKLLVELLREFQRNRLHMAIVIDEFGGTAGLITLEDILEEIVGEIQDEYDIEQHSMEIGADRKSISLSADHSIADANLELEKIFPHFQIPEDEEYESVSGYVNKLFGHIPEVGEAREVGTVKIIVTEKGPMNVSEVRFEKTK
jgi:CBS domain containing-hemolysin-like protein